MSDMLPNEVYANLFQTDPTGKKVFEELCAFHYDIESFDAENTHITAFNEGRREVIRWIMLKMDLGRFDETDE